MRLSAIDGLRAIAVLAVVVCHASLTPYAVVGSRGVDLFFVISGLCLSLPALRKGEGVKPYAFWASRFWRIAPPYWIALAIFFALSFTAFGTPSTIGTSGPLELPQEIFLFTGLHPMYNDSFWTLAFEARWYIFFPAILALYMRSKIGFAVLALVMYAWYASPYRMPDAGALPCFMLGIVAADLALRQRERINHPLLPLLALASIAVAVYYDKSDNHGDPLWHLAAFLTVLAGLGAGAKILSWKPLAFIGVASFSIYLMHQPFLLWIGGHGVPPIAAALISIAIGIVFWRVVEVPSLAFRKRLQSRPSVQLRPEFAPEASTH